MFKKRNDKNHEKKKVIKVMLKKIDKPLEKKKQKRNGFFKELGATFKATGATHVYKNRKTIIKSIAFAFIPFLYAFIALWAFFDPLGNINNLPIALVNQDTSASGDKRIVNLSTLDLNGKTPNKLGAYEMPLDNVNVNGTPKNFKVYYFDNDATYQSHKDDTTFLTEIFLDKKFTNQWTKYFTDVGECFKNNLGNPIAFLTALGEITDPKPQITLQASYKDNPIIGEINDFALGTLKNTVFENFFPVVATNYFFEYWQNDAIKNPNPDGSPDYTHLDNLYGPNTIKRGYQLLAGILPALGRHQADFDAGLEKVVSNNNNVTFKQFKAKELLYWQENPLTDLVQFFNLNINIIGHDKAAYGFGLAPFFICIGLWVGTLLLTFNFTRKKPTPNAKFWSNYLAKTMWMIIFGLVQATILTTSLLLLFNAPDMFARCWQFYLFMWFVVICFDLIIQAIAHMFRDHDIGRFLIIILLILQLTSSSGTFPVALSATFFQIVSHFLPFTYAINVFRQILIVPPNGSVSIILTNVGILLAFAIGFLIVSFLINWLYDYLDNKRSKENELKIKKHKFFWRDQKDSSVEEIEIDQEK